MSEFNSAVNKSADIKNRWGGLLEIPVLSRIQRDLLDAGRVNGLKRALQEIEYIHILDVGCGLGECSVLKKETYIGIDNSFKRIQYASKRYSHCKFLVADVRSLPFHEGFFDLVMMIDTSHHLTDEEFLFSLRKLEQLTSKYILISDPVLYKNQSKISTCAYQMDRGQCFRYADQMKCIFEQLNNMSLVKTYSFRTFPGLYLHTAFILEKNVV